MGNPERSHFPPPLPEQSKKPAKEEIELTEADIEEIPDYTASAVEVDVAGNGQGSAETREGISEIMRIQEAREGKETLSALHEAVALSADTSKHLDAKEAMINGPVAGQAKAASEAHGFQVAKKEVGAAYERAELPSATSIESQPVGPSEEAKMAIAQLESKASMLQQDVDAMERSIKEKFGVDADAQSTKGLFGRIGFGFKNAFNGELRKALGEYRTNRDQLNA